MSTHADITQEDKSTSVAQEKTRYQNSGKSTFQLIDNRAEATAQRKLQEVANNSTRGKQLRHFEEMANAGPQAKQAPQVQAMADNHAVRKQHPVQRKANQTGLPDKLKAGIENLSGYSMDAVKVHYNSEKPAQLQAHAYTQGTDIHVAAGQEKHLPHEAWHVVQQKQGRVQPTLQMQGGALINDDDGLEKEADVMGQNAAHEKAIVHERGPVQEKPGASDAPGRPNIAQRVIRLDGAETNTGDLIAEAADMAEKIIIANWAWSLTEHDFKKNTRKNISAKEKLLEAIQRAKGSVKVVPALFCAANLMFLTQTEDRLPTLYFKQGENSGRLRQQHGSGPAAFTETNKTDYFFASKDKLKVFGRAAKKAMRNKTDFEPDLATYEASINPGSGNAHYEVTYNGKKVIKIHPSGGKIVTELAGYTDIRIQAIYQGIIGVTT